MAVAAGLSSLVVYVAGPLERPHASTVVGRMAGGIRCASRSGCSHAERRAAKRGEWVPDDEERVSRERRVHSKRKRESRATAGRNRYPRGMLRGRTGSG